MNVPPGGFVIVSSMPALYYEIPTRSKYRCFERCFRLVTSLGVLFLAIFAPRLRGEDIMMVKIPANAGGEEIQKALDRMPNGGTVELPAGISP